MIKLKSILSEALSDTVWHFTSHDGAKNIIEKNKFELSIAVESDISKFGGNKQFYLSTARQKRGGYGRGRYFRFELDGRKLSQRYRGGAIDYWQRGPESSEYEDRLFSDDPTIPNAKNYIKRLDLLLDVDPRYTRDINRVVDVMEVCLKHNVKCYLFRDRNGFETDRRGELVTKELADALRQPTDPDDAWNVSMPKNPKQLEVLVYMSQLLGISKEELNKLFVSDKTAEKNFNRRMMGLEPESRKKYGSYDDWIKKGWKEYEDKLWNMKYTFRSPDARGIINVEIHNTKRSMGSVAREILVRIFKEARKKKITPDNLTDFVLQLAKEES